MQKYYLQHMKQRQQCTEKKKRNIQQGVFKMPEINSRKSVMAVDVNINIT